MINCHNLWHWQFRERVREYDEYESWPVCDDVLDAFESALVRQVSHCGEYGDAARDARQRVDGADERDAAEDLAVETVVAREGHDAAERDADRVEHLRGSVNPNLWTYTYKRGGFGILQIMHT